MTSLSGKRKRKAAFDVYENDEKDIFISKAVVLSTGYHAPSVRSEFGSARKLLNVADLPNVTMRACEALSKTANAFQCKPSLSKSVPMSFYADYELRLQESCKYKEDVLVQYLVTSLVTHLEDSDVSERLVLWALRSHVVEQAQFASALCDVVPKLACEMPSHHFSLLLPILSTLSSQNIFVYGMTMHTLCSVMKIRRLQCWIPCAMSDLLSRVPLFNLDEKNRNHLKRCLREHGEEEKGDIDEGEESEGEEDCQSPGEEEKRAAAIIALFRLLDHIHISPQFSLTHLLQQIANIREPSELLFSLLRWAVHLRSSAGAVLAARIIRRWNLPNSRRRLLYFFTSEGPRLSDRVELDRFISSLCRLHCQLEYAGVLSHSDILTYLIGMGVSSLHESTHPSWLSSLLFNLPITSNIGSSEARRQRRSFLFGFSLNADENDNVLQGIYARIVALLNELFCSDAFAANAPLKKEHSIQEKALLVKFKCLSCHDAMYLSEMASRTLLGALEDAVDGKRRVMEEKGRLWLPRLAAFRLVFCLLNVSVDSTSSSRFFLSALPSLHLLSSHSSALSSYVQSLALLFLSHCIRHRNAFIVSSLYKPIMRELRTLLSASCPLHWQIQLLSSFSATVAVTGKVCAKHGREKRRVRERDDIVNAFLLTATQSRNPAEIESAAATLGDECASEPQLRGLILSAVVKMHMKRSHPCIGQVLSTLASHGCLSLRESVLQLLAILERDAGRVQAVQSILTALSLIRSLLSGKGRAREGAWLVQGSLAGAARRFACVLIHLIHCEHPGWEGVRAEAKTLCLKIAKQEWARGQLRRHIHHLAIACIHPDQWRSLLPSLACHRRLSSCPDSPLLLCGLDELSLVECVNEAVLYAYSALRRGEEVDVLAAGIIVALREKAANSFIALFAFQSMLHSFTHSEWRTSFLKNDEKLAAESNAVNSREMAEAMAKALLTETTIAVEKGDSRLISLPAWKSMLREAWMQSPLSHQNLLLCAFKDRITIELSLPRLSTPTFSTFLETLLPLLHADYGVACEWVVVLYRAMVGGAVCKEKNRVLWCGCLSTLIRLLGSCWGGRRRCLAGWSRLKRLAESLGQRDIAREAKCGLALLLPSHYPLLAHSYHDSPNESLQISSSRYSIRDWLEKKQRLLSRWRLLYKVTVASSCRAGRSRPFISISHQVNPFCPFGRTGNCFP